MNPNNLALQLPKAEFYVADIVFHPLLTATDGFKVFKCMIGYLVAHFNMIARFGLGGNNYIFSANVKSLAALSNIIERVNALVAKTKKPRVGAFLPIRREGM